MLTDLDRGLAHYYLTMAYKLATRHSDDTRTKLGAVIVQGGDRVVGAGVNKLPVGVDHYPNRTSGKNKYTYMEHAERNAVFHAARHGKATSGATMYAPWFACADCARAIIQAGITQVVGHQACYDRTGTGHWSESIEAGNTMLREAGVTTWYYEGQIGGVEALLGGEKWEP